MKKFLAMSLTLTMLASMLAMPASAYTFTDDSQVQYNEAVDVISAIDIIGGYADGSFNPQGTLTRGAAAKIICNMLLGPTTAEALGADTAPFPDVAIDHTFAGYIAYCSAQGIINGYEDGTFRPAGEVTGNQFMKMLLGALGYSSANEGFTGANWSINVTKLALSLGLDDGNDAYTGSTSMTREEACLYAFNTLSTTMVEYESNGSDIVVGDVNITVGASKATELANKSSTDGNIADDGLMQFAEKNFTSLKQTDTSADNFGRPAREWSVSKDSVGTYVDLDALEASYTGDVTRGGLYTLLGKSLTSNLSSGDNTLTVFVDGLETQVDAADIGNYVRSNSSSKVAESGTQTQVFLSDDNDVTLVLVNTYVVQATEDYNEKTEDVDFTDAGDTAISFASTALSMDDFDVADVMEDDYLLVQAYRSTDGGKYTVEAVEKASLLVGEVSTFSKATSVTIDGVKYTYAPTAKTDVYNTTYTIGEDTSVVLDQYGNIIAIDQVVTSSENYVFIRETDTVGSFGGSVYAAAFFVDGTYGEIELKKVDDNTDDASLVAASGWYTYAVDSNDKYTLTVLDAEDESADSATFTSEGTALSVTTSGRVSFLTGQTVKANGSTVFVAVDADGDLYLYTGVTNLPSISTSTVSGNEIRVNWVADTSGFASYVFIDMSDDAKADVDSDEDSASDLVYILALDASGKDNNGDNFYSYDAIVDGVVTTIVADSNSVFTADTLYGTLKTNDSGYVTSAKAIADTSDYDLGDIDDTLSHSNGTVEIGSDDFIITDDTQIILVSYSSDLNSDDGVDYEVTTTLNGKSLHNLVKEYTTITGSYYAVLNDSNSSTVDALYITITAVA